MEGAGPPLSLGGTGVKDRAPRPPSIPLGLWGWGHGEGAALREEEEEEEGVPGEEELQLRPA